MTVTLLDPAPTDGEFGHLSTHGALAGMFNAYVKADRSGLYLPGDFEPVAVEQSWGPTLRSSGGTQPSLGTGSKTVGSFRKKGPAGSRWCEASGGVLFGTSSIVEGDGQYSIDLPVRARQPAAAQGFSSDMVGWGRMYRGADSNDLVGAHQLITLHTAAAGDGSKALMLSDPGAWALDFQQSLTTENPEAGSPQAFGTTAETILGDGPSAQLAVTVTVRQRNARYRVDVALPCFASAANIDGFVQILDNGTVVWQEPFTSPGGGAGNAFLQGFPIRATYALRHPTIGNHVFTVKAVTISGTVTVSTSGANHQWGTLRAAQLPGFGEGNGFDGEYVGNAQPYHWGDTTIGAEIWCGLSYPCVD